MEKLLAQLKANQLTDLIFSKSSFEKPEPITLVGHTEAVISLAVLADGKVVSGSYDNTLKVWNMQTGECEQTLAEHTDAVRSLAVLADGRVVSGSYDNTLKVWNVQTGECEQTLAEHTDAVTSLAVLADGKVVSGSVDNTLKVWNMQTGECEQTLAGHTAPVISLAVLADGRVVSGSYDNTFKVWYVQTGEYEQTLAVHTEAVYCLAVLADGSVVSGLAEGTLKVWNVQTGECEQTLAGHIGVVRSLAVLADGRVVSGSDDNTLKVWNVQTGECEQTLAGHTDVVRSLAMLADGRVVSGSDDQTLKVWNLAPKLQNYLTLLHAAITNTSLKTLSLADIKFQAEWMEPLTQILLQHPRLATLDLSRCKLSDAQLCQLWPALVDSRALQTVLLADNPISPSWMPRLQTLLRRPRKDALDHSKIAEDFLCPISKQIMLDPVSTENGYEYEREEIEKWFAKCEAGQARPVSLKAPESATTSTQLTEPETGEIISDKTLRPAVKTRGRIKNFLEKQPEYWDEVYWSPKWAQSALQAIQHSDEQALTHLLIKDARILTHTLDGKQDLLTAACQAGTVSLVSMVITKLANRLWQLPSIYQDRGLNLVTILANRLGEAAQCLADALGWEKQDYQQLATSALQQTNANLLKLALSGGADIQQLDDKGNTLLLQAVQNNDTPLVQFLLSAAKESLDIRHTNQQGEDALIVAVKTQQQAMVKLLVEQFNFSGKQADSQGNTALHYAVQAGNSEMVALLLTAFPDGSALQQLNKQGDNVLLLAIKAKQPTIVELLMQRPLLAIAQADTQGNTALHYAVQQGDSKLVALIAAHCSENDLNLTNEQGDSAFMLSVKTKRLDCVKSLLQQPKFNVNQADKLGNTPLHYAAMVGDEHLALSLLEHGAAIKASNHELLTPIKLAQAKGHHALAKQLKAIHQQQKFQPLLQPLQQQVKQLELQCKQLVEQDLLNKQALEKQQKVFAFFGKHAGFFGQVSKQMLATSHAIAGGASFAVLPDNKIAMVTASNILQVLDIRTGQFEQSMQEHQGRVSSMLGLPDGKMVSGTEDGKLMFWNMKTGQCERTVQEHTRDIWSLVLANGKVVSGSIDNSIKVWNINTGQCEKTLQGHTSGVYSLEVLADGRVISASCDDTIKIWNVLSGQCEQTLQGHTGGVRCLVVLANGKVISGGGDNTLKIWNINTGQCEKTLHSSHTSTVVSLVKLANGRVVSGSGDKTIKIWNTDTGQCEQTLSGHTAYVRKLAVLSDGRIVSGSEDKTLRIWPLDPLANELDELAHHVPECRLM